MTDVARLRHPDDARRLARARERRAALEAFVSATDPVDLESYLRRLAQIDGDAHAHAVPPMIA